LEDFWLVFLFVGRV